MDPYVGHCYLTVSVTLGRHKYFLIISCISCWLFFITRVPNNTSDSEIVDNILFSLKFTIELLEEIIQFVAERLMACVHKNIKGIFRKTILRATHFIRLAGRIIASRTADYFVYGLRH